MTRLSVFVAFCLLFVSCGGQDVPATANHAGSDSLAADTATDTNTTTSVDTPPAPDTTERTTEPDVAVEPPPPDCNPITNTGCEEGQKCIYGSTDAKVCSPAGDTPGGSPCQDTSECAEGMCLSINGTDSYCYTFCKTIGHCPNSAPCLELSDSTYKVCEIADLYDSCDILAQDCEGDKACYSIAGENEPVCLPAGTEPVGGVCDGPSDCSPGHHCVNFRCYEICDKNDPESCGLFVDCAGFVAAGVGYCDEQQ